jgi:hypothetical protein
MGARTLVDMFMTRHVGDIGGFEAKLSELVDKGYLSTRNKDILAAAIEAGNAAAHRGYKPEKSDVERVIDIVENMLQFDVLDASAKALRSSTPPRSGILAVSLTCNALQFPSDALLLAPCL